MVTVFLETPIVGVKLYHGGFNDPHSWVDAEIVNHIVR